MGSQRIWVAGDKGMVGSAIARRLEQRGGLVLKANREVVDLRNQICVEVRLSRVSSNRRPGERPEASGRTCKEFHDRDYRLWGL